jgi:NAD(P)-dependent dehydrogenase (short-subunit alcohol dehydrogenase family)
LGADRLRLLGIGDQHPQGHDPLRHDQDGAAGHTRGLAELTAGTDVTVNAVLPGPTRSDGIEPFLDAMAAQEGVPVDQLAAEFVKQHRPTSLLQRFATVDEIANMVVYLCSKEASATNGAPLRVEGGIIRSMA